MYNMRNTHFSQHWPSSVNLKTIQYDNPSRQKMYLRLLDLGPVKRSNHKTLSRVRHHTQFMPKGKQDLRLIMNFFRTNINKELKIRKVAFDGMDGFHV